MAQIKTNSGAITAQNMITVFLFVHAQLESVGPLIFGCMDVQTHARIVRRQLFTIDAIERSAWASLLEDPDGVTDASAAVTELFAWGMGKGMP